jgi:hypothetical protein
MSGMGWPEAAVLIVAVLGGLSVIPAVIMATAWAEKRGSK